MEELLKAAGLKVTPRRLAMLRILLDAAAPLTAEEVHGALEAEHRADLSTVYRALGTMAEQGLLRKTVCQDGKVYYGFQPEQHSHKLTCERCHASVPIDLCPLEQLARTLHDDTGYEITGHRFELSGICPRCAGKRRNG